MTEQGIDRSFIMELDDRCAWNVTGCGNAESWVRKFASVLGLRAGSRDGFSQVHFICLDEEEAGAKEHDKPPHGSGSTCLQDGSWKPTDMGLIRVWVSRQAIDHVIELIDSNAKELAIIMMAQALHPVYAKAIAFGGLPVHGALVARDGKGVVLAGPNDAGKTTCCRRLPPSWKVLSDDETLLLHRPGQGYYAHPLPTWSDHLRDREGYQCQVEQGVALAGIFFLEQAPYLETLPMGRGRTAGAINEAVRQSSFWRFQGPHYAVGNARTKNVFENACVLAKAVRGYRLRLSLTDAFWEPIEGLLEEASNAEGEL